MVEQDLILKTGEVVRLDLDEMERSIQTCSLGDLTDDQKQQLAKLIYIEKQKESYKKDIELRGINYKEKKEKFLSCYHSEFTQTTYNRALERLEDFANGLNKSPLSLSTAEIDSFIITINGTANPNTSRVTIAGLSAFYTFMERETDFLIHNPVRGTKLRPRSTARKHIYPTTPEVQTIYARMPYEMKLLTMFLAYRGLRVGALPKLKIDPKTGDFETFTKGKGFSGKLINEKELILQTLKDSGLDQQTPFVNCNQKTLVNKFKYYTVKLYEQGSIKAPYSCHDLRHYFAITEYAKDYNIKRVSKLLGHSNIAITDVYLNELGIKDNE